MLSIILGVTITIVLALIVLLLLCAAVLHFTNTEINIKKLLVDSALLLVALEASLVMMFFAANIELIFA